MIFFFHHFLFVFSYNTIYTMYHWATVHVFVFLFFAWKSWWFFLIPLLLLPSSLAPLTLTYIHPTVWDLTERQPTVSPAHGIVWQSGCVLACVCVRVFQQRSVRGTAFTTDRMCVRFEHLSSAPLKVSGGVRVEVRELEGRLEWMCVCVRVWMWEWWRAGGLCRGTGGQMGREIEVKQKV